MLFLRCPVCRDASLSIQNPLCSICFHSLTAASKLCKKCGSNICPENETCLQPWNNSSSIQSYNAGYDLVGRSFQILKAWKNKGGWRFNRTLLNEGVLDQLRWVQNLDAIIPIPQKFERSLELQRNPAYSIAAAISEKHKVPVLEILEINESNQNERQARGDLIKRFQLSKNFYANAQQIVPEKILLVDDFMTSGETLRKASKSLSRLGVIEIHCFCLGVRPRLIKRTHQSFHLKQA